eukprot:1328279-Prymnesium_polylepis.1
MGHLASGVAQSTAFTKTGPLTLLHNAQPSTQRICRGRVPRPIELARHTSARQEPGKRERSERAELELLKTVPLIV